MLSRELLIFVIVLWKIDFKEDLWVELQQDNRT